MAVYVTLLRQAAAAAAATANVGSMGTQPFTLRLTKTQQQRVSITAVVSSQHGGHCMGTDRP